MPTILDCKAVAASIEADCLRHSERLKSHGFTPKCAILRVGEAGPDMAYEKGAAKSLHRMGIDVTITALPADVSEEDYIAAMNGLNNDASVSGILPFRPLHGLDENKVISGTIDPRKDVDSTTPENMGRVVLNDPAALPPCTAQAVLEVLDFYHIPLEGKNVVVVNRSNVIGKPVAMMLVNRHATVSVCHSRTADLRFFTRSADIVVAAVPKRNALTAADIRPGTVVIDAAVLHIPMLAADGSPVLSEKTGRPRSRSVGCCADDVADVAGAITPVPGLGAVTSALLGKNVIKACCLTHNFAYI